MPEKLDDFCFNVPEQEAFHTVIVERSCSKKRGGVWSKDEKGLVRVHALLIRLTAEKSLAFMTNFVLRLFRLIRPKIHIKEDKTRQRPPTCRSPNPAPLAFGCFDVSRSFVVAVARCGGGWCLDSRHCNRADYLLPAEEQGRRNVCETRSDSLGDGNQGRGACRVRAVVINQELTNRPRRTVMEVSDFSRHVT